MPKLFPINIEVEESKVGEVYRRLDNMEGVAKIKIGNTATSYSNGHDKEPRQSTPRGPQKVFKTTGQEAVIKMLYGAPPMTTGQLRDVFVSQGRSPSSINSVIHTMIKAGEAQVTDDGYTLTKKMRDRLRHRVAAKGKKK